MLKIGPLHRAPAELPNAARNALGDQRGRSERAVRQRLRERRPFCWTSQEQRDTLPGKCFNSIKPDTEAKRFGVGWSRSRSGNSAVPALTLLLGKLLAARPSLQTKGTQPTQTSALFALKHHQQTTSQHSAPNTHTRFVPKNCQGRRKGNNCSVASEGLLTGEPPLFLRPAPN